MRTDEEVQERLSRIKDKSQFVLEKLSVFINETVREFDKKDMDVLVPGFVSALSVSMAVLIHSGFPHESRDLIVDTSRSIVLKVLKALEEHNGEEEASSDSFMKRLLESFTGL